MDHTIPIIVGVLRIELSPRDPEPRILPVDHTPRYHIFYPRYSLHSSPSPLTALGYRYSPTPPDRSSQLNSYVIPSCLTQVMGIDCSNHCSQLHSINLHLTLINTTKHNINRCQYLLHTLYISIDSPPCSTSSSSSATIINESSLPAALTCVFSLNVSPAC